MSSLKNPTKTDMQVGPPTIVLWLAYSGLVPFVALAVLSNVPWAYVELCRSMLLGYGAIILSFVGAQHWAFAMNAPALSADGRAQGFAWSVVPALIAWIALSIPAAAASLQLAAAQMQLAPTALIATGFLVQYAQDRRIAQTVALPAWYLPLRARLTAIVSVCLALLAASQMRI